MLPRRQRLSRAGFSALSHGKRAHSAHFMVVWSLVGAAGGVATVVSKKVAPRSVDRHLIKRRMSAALRGMRFPGLALAIHAKRGVLGLPYPALRAELLGVVRSLQTA